MGQTPDPERTLQASAAAAVPARGSAPVKRAAKFFLQRLFDTHISSAAAALSYSTTLAMVPALALTCASC